VIAMDLGRLEDNLTHELESTRRRLLAPETIL
jgi:hypothetical protein